jgi:tetratricopeptide (TPR) repeat protein
MQKFFAPILSFLVCIKSLSANIGPGDWVMPRLECNMIVDGNALPQEQIYAPMIVREVNGDELITEQGTVHQSEVILIRHNDAINITTARRYYTDVIDADKSLAEAYRYRAVLFLINSQVLLSEDDIKRAIALNPNRPFSHKTYGDIFLKKKEYKQAINEYRRVVELSPKWSMSHHNLGVALYARGEYANALSSFDESLRIDPELAEAWQFSGEALFILGRYDRAVLAFSRAIEINPTDALYQKCATAYCNCGNFAMAIDQYDRDLTLPFNPTRRGFRAFLLLRTGRTDEAKRECDQALLLQPHNSVLLRIRSELKGVEGNSREQLADLRSSVLNNPAESSGAMDLAMFLASHVDEELRSGAWAVIYGKTACELTEWKDPDALASLAAGYAEENDFGRAIEIQKMALEAAQTRADMKMTSQLSLFETIQREHRITPAERAVFEARFADCEKQCNSSEWRDAALIDRLAVLAAELGNFVEAKRIQQKAREAINKTQVVQLNGHLALYTDKKPLRLNKMNEIRLRR